MRGVCSSAIYVHGSSRTRKARTNDRWRAIVDTNGHATTSYGRGRRPPLVTCRDLDQD